MNIRAIEKIAAEAVQEDGRVMDLDAYRTEQALSMARNQEQAAYNRFMGGASPFLGAIISKICWPSIRGIPGGAPGSILQESPEYFTGTRKGDLIGGIGAPIIGAVYGRKYLDKAKEDFRRADDARREMLYARHAANAAMDDNPPAVTNADVNVATSK